MSGMRILIIALIVLTVPFGARSQSTELETAIEKNPVDVIRSMTIQTAAKQGASDAEIRRLFDSIENAFSVITSETSDEPCFFGCDGGITGGAPSFAGADYRKFTAHIMLAQLASDLGYLPVAKRHLETAEILFLRHADAVKKATGYRSYMYGWTQHWGCIPSPISPSDAAADLAHVAREAGLTDLAIRTEGNWKLRLEQPRQRGSIRILGYLPDVSY